MKRIFLATSLIAILSASSALAEKINKKTANISSEPKNTEISSSLVNQASFFDDKVTVTFPAAFKALPLSVIETRYSDGKNRPKFVFAPVDDYSVNLSLNLVSNQNGDRDSLIKFFRDVKNGLRAQYPNDVEFMRSDVNNASQTAFIEFIMPDRQKDKFYNLMFFAYVGSDFFFMNFSCPKAEMDKWQKTAWSIVESFKAKK